MFLFAVFGYVATAMTNNPMIMLISYGIILIYNLAVLLPTLSVSARRLHDINRSGLWLLLYLVPLGPLVLVVMFCLKGVDGINRFDRTVPVNDGDELYTFEDEDNVEISEDEKEDKLNEIKDLSEKDPFTVGSPQNLIIGYIEEITKKGLKEYIIGQTYKYFPSPHYTVYRIEKYNKGFIYEIHDGGKKLTHLKRIKSEFDAGENELILKTAGNYVKVAKSGHKIDCMILQESDLEYDNDNAKLIDTFDMTKMDEAVPLGAGIFLSGLMFLSFGVISLFFSVLFKYGLLSLKEDPIEIKTKLEVMPHVEFEGLPQPTEFSYVEKLFLVGNKWEFTMKEIDRPDPVVEGEMTGTNDFIMDKVENIEDYPEMPIYDEVENYDKTDMPAVSPDASDGGVNSMDIPFDESGEPVNIFEIDNDKIINEDSIKKEIVQDVDAQVIINSPK
jgi:hypothetical protein